MARLTLSEQINLQATQISTLTAELHAAQIALVSAQNDVTDYKVTVQELGEVLRTVPELRDQVNKLTKELDGMTSNNKYNYEGKVKAEAELEQTHSILDCIEGAPAREFEQEYGKGKRTVTARIAGALIAVAKGAAK